MIQELIYTSVPHGLNPDSSGFCTVACTEGMATNLQGEMERLSGYRHLAEPNAKLTPNVLMHAIRRIGGSEFHILSRVAYCAEDYTGRTNKIAHHLALDTHELRDCGPAAILFSDENQDIFRKEWNETPDTIKIAKRLPNITYAPQKCVSWERVFGDAGYAGLAAQAAEEGRPINLIFRPEMPIQPIQLIAEALSLLPPTIRWNVSFSSYFLKTQENEKSKIQWKCILAKSEEMAVSRLTSKTLFIDLADLAHFKARNPLEGRYVDAARDIGARRRQIATSGGAGRTGMANIADVPYDIDQWDLIHSTKGVPTDVKLRKKSYRGVWIMAILLLLILSAIGTTIGVAVIKSRNAAEQKRLDKEAAETAEQDRLAQEAAETAEQDRLAQEAAETAEQERLAQEAAEQAEQERLAQEAAEQAEQERLAQEAAEQAERERLAKEAADKAILDALPSDFWQDGENRGIFMRPAPSHLEAGLVSILKNSTDLWRQKERITLEIIPYFLQALEIKDKGGIYKIYVGEKKQHKISFYLDKQDQDNRVDPIKTIEIATIELTEGGIQFQWAGDSSLADELQNRVLLSVLKISVGGQTKEIPLYKPIVREHGMGDSWPKLGDSIDIWEHQDDARKVFVGKAEEYWISENRIDLLRKSGENLTFELGPLDDDFDVLSDGQRRSYRANVQDNRIIFIDDTGKSPDVTATLNLGEKYEKVYEEEVEVEEKGVKKKIRTGIEKIVSVTMKIEWLNVQNDITKSLTESLKEKPLPLKIYLKHPTDGSKLLLLKCKLKTD